MIEYIVEKLIKFLGSNNFEEKEAIPRISQSTGVEIGSNDSFHFDTGTNQPNVEEVFMRKTKNSLSNNLIRRPSDLKENKTLILEYGSKAGDNKTAVDVTDGKYSIHVYTYNYHNQNNVDT